MPSDLLARDTPGDRNNYFYNASVPAAAIFSVLFGLVTIVHMAQAWRYKTAYMIVLLLALWQESIGYVTRIISIKWPDPSWSVILSQTTIIVAPAFLAAQSYMIVGRIMAYVGSEYSYVKHTRITKFFVAADIFAIITQAAGGSMLAAADGDLNQMRNAQKLLLGGLALQVITFGIFMFVAIIFDVRSCKSPALKPHEPEMKRLRGLWWAFYISSVLITARSIYRTVEFAEIKFEPGNDDPVGYALTHEWVFYVFDSIPVLIAVILFAIWHPGMYLPQKKGLRIDGNVEEIPGRRRFLCCGPRKQRKTRGTQLHDPEQGAVHSRVALHPIQQ